MRVGSALERSQLEADLVGDELVEIPALVVFVGAAATALGVSGTGGLGSGAAAQHEHVGAAGVLGDLSEHELADVVHARGSDGEQLDAVLRGCSMLSLYWVP